MTRLSALAGVMLFGATAACGLTPTAAPRTMTPTGRPSPPQAMATSRSPERARLAVPDEPCQVLSDSMRSRMGMRQGTKDRLDPACKWSNNPGDAPPFKFRDLSIGYDAGFKKFSFSLKDAKESFAAKRRSDYRRPSVFAAAPSVRRTIEQVGTAKVGKHFDEGYYVYFVYQVGEARRGEGKTVLRRGNVVITISLSGADVSSRSMRDSKPISDDTAQAMIDIVAARAIAAVR